MLLPLFQVVALHLVGKKSIPGHLYRFSSKKFSPGSVSRPKLLSVALFPKQQVENYKADNEAKLLSGYVKIFPGSSEVQIRKTVTKLFKTRFALTSDKDYDFVKRIRNVISKPVIRDGFEGNLKL